MNRFSWSRAGAVVAVFLVVAGPGAGADSPYAARHHTIGGLDSTLAGVAAAQHAKGTSGALAAASSADVNVRQSKVEVLVKASDPAAARAAVAAGGGTVTAAVDNTLAVLVPPKSLEALAVAPGVDSVHETDHAEAQTVTDEAVASTGAATVQAGGIDGSGVKIAVIDLGFQQINTVFGNVSPSWLNPQNFGCSGFSPLAGGLDNWGATEHGTAVTEAVHQMAPGATVFAMCVATNADLWTAEQWAVAAGVKIINHSVAWFGSSRGDGTGGAFSPDAAVADARAHGVLWVNAAGNEAQDHWSGTYTPDPAQPSINDFSSRDETDTIQIGAHDTACMVLTWDAWPVTTEDYDWYLFPSGNTTTPVAWSTNDQAGDPNLPGDAPPDQPVEDSCYTNPGSTTASYDLVIEKYSAQGNASLQLWVLGAAGEEYATAAGSIPEPASSPDAFAVGAVCWQDGATEFYSSRGPTVDGRTKPDIAGPDATSSDVYGIFSACPTTSAITGFAGTSAAAPHVAGAAALLLQQSPSLTVAGLESRLQELAAAHAGLTGAQADDVGTGTLWVGAQANPGRIVFGDQNNGANGIYSMNADGTGLQALATGTGNDPAVSPDGTKIAFSTNDGAAIDVMNADGSGVTAVWTAALGHAYRSPSWSPDGTKLAFRNGGGIAVGKADGTGSLTPLSLPGYNADEPVWSPDGAKLAVLGTGSFSTDIWTIAVSDGTATQITTVGNVLQRERSLAWSAAGLAFSAGDTGTQVYQLWTMPADLSSAPTQITTGTTAGTHFDPTWSPDGSKILYSDEFGNGTGGGLHAVLADGTADTLIRSTPFGGWFMADPQWTSGASSPPWVGGLPQLSSPPSVGIGVEATPGRWDGPRPITFSYAWSRCNASGASCATIAGATDDRYVPVSGDVGSTLKVTVTAADSFGSATATSSASAAVAAAPAYATAVPTISGTTTEGSTLSAGSSGSWSSSTSFTYEWLRCDTDGTDCFQASVVSPTGTSYALSSGDVGHRLRLGVQSTDSGRWATSLASAVVAAAPAPPTPTPTPTPTPAPPAGGGGDGGGGSSGIPPDIHVAVTASYATTPAPGSDFDWFVTVSSKNVGGSSDVRLDVTLPEGWTYDHLLLDRGQGCTVSLPKVSCDVAFINQSASSHLTFFGKVAQQTDLSLTATATSQLEPELDPSDNTVTLKVAGPAAVPPPPPAAPLPPKTPPSPVKPPLAVPVLTPTTARIAVPRGAKVQWQLCTPSRCTPIRGATKPTLKLTAAYTGRSVRAVVTRNGTTTVSKKVTVRARAVSR